MSKAALRTVTSMWSMSMACMGAWLGGRGLTYGGRRTHPTQSEHHRAPPATLYRAGPGTWQLRSAPQAATQEAAALQRSMRSGPLLESGVSPALLRPRFDIKLRAIHWMPRRCTFLIDARVCSFSRMSETQTLPINNAYLAVQHVDVINRCYISTVDGNVHLNMAYKKEDACSLTFVAGKLV